MRNTLDAYILIETSVATLLFNSSGFINTWPLFTKRVDVLPQDLVKYRSREFRVLIFEFALKFERNLGNTGSKPNNTQLSISYRLVFSGGPATTLSKSWNIRLSSKPDS